MTRRTASVLIEPLGKNDLYQETFGGADPYGLSLLVPLVLGAASLLWRAVHGRGRWRVTVIDRDTGAVIHTEVVFGKAKANRRRQDLTGRYAV